MRFISFMRTVTVAHTTIHATASHIDIHAFFTSIVSSSPQCPPPFTFALAYIRLLLELRSEYVLHFCWWKRACCVVYDACLCWRRTRGEFSKKCVRKVLICRVYTTYTIIISPPRIRMADGTRDSALGMRRKSSIVSATGLIAE